jgi:hypothetical protein
MATVTATGIHPPGCYYVNIATGTIQRQCNPVLAIALAAAGYFGNPGPASATNAFATFDAAHAFAASQSGSAASGDVTGGVSSATKALGSLNPLAPLFQSNIWLRAGEFLIGIVLIGVGLAKITGTENFVSNVVRKVPIG